MFLNLVDRDVCFDLEISVSLNHLFNGLLFVHLLVYVVCQKLCRSLILSNNLGVVRIHQVVC
jgi:hypothetical protein